MKRIIRVAALLIVMSIFGSITAACAGDLPSIPEEGASIRIIIGVEDVGDEWGAVLVAAAYFDVVTHRRFVGQVLDDLSYNEELVFVYGGSSLTGRFVEALGDLVPDDTLAFPSFEYIAILANGIDIRFVMPINNRTVDGYNFWFTNFGIDTLPVVDGATYLFMIANQNWAF